VARALLRLTAQGLLLLGLMLLLGLLLTHVLDTGPVAHLDDSIERALASHRTSTGNTLTAAGTQLAEPLNVEIALGVLVLALAALTRRVRPPLFLAVAVGVESAIYFVTSTLIPRDRPHVPRLGVGDPVASYPSGHAAASLCLYGGLAVLAWRCTRNRPLQVGLTALAVVVPPIVGFCRMYRGFHHLTDVLAGLLLGGTWLWLTTRALLAEERPR
jgi:membrane-associated phospholipid phosphatase